MAIAAGILGILFGLLHAVQGRELLIAPAARRGSGEVGAIPLPARRLWVALALLTIVASLVLLAIASVGVFVFEAIGVVGITLLAIANGFWMHGRPTVLHHVVRFVMAAVVLGVGAAAVGLL